MTLKTCGRADCAPVEQTRGDMRPGDYHDIIAANSPERWGGIKEPHKYGVVQGSPEAAAADAAHIVEMNDADRDDYRICCKFCGKATPWNKCDAPGMPGVGKMFTQNRWNGGQ